MELRPGYTQTDIGVIPKDWDLRSLEELFTFSGGFPASRDQLSTEGHCYLHYGDIHGSTRPFLDTRADYLDIPKLEIPLKRIAPQSLLKDGDVVFVDASEDDEGASKHVVIVNRENIPFISGLHTIVAKSRTNELVHEYRRYCFQTASVRQQFLFYAVGTKVTGISKTNIRKVLLPVPPIPEQRAIAAALSDIDALLEDLTGLIAKKRDLKQGARQQLLTGQTRLSGFGGEWVMRRVGELLDYERPDRYIVRSDEYADRGDIPVLTANKSFILGYTTEEFGVCRELPVIVFDDFTTDSKFVALPFKVKSSAIKLLRPKHERVSLRYVFERIQLIRFPSGDHKRHYISEFQNIQLPFPDYDEQLAVIRVLSDMDAEISALEARRDKTRLLKQGMTQELPTGRMRLVPAGGDRA